MFLGSLNQTSGNFLSSQRTIPASVPIRHIVISRGDLGIYETVRLIKDQVQQGIRQPTIRATVQSILAGLPSGSSQNEIAQAFVKWFGANIRYRLDDDVSMTEHGLQPIHIAQCPIHYRHCEAVEIVSTPPQILAQRSEDCDGQVLLMGTFLTLAGIKWCPVIVALDPSIPREFTHIYLIANLDGSFVPIDTVNTSQPFGWEPPNPIRREVLC